MTELIKIKPMFNTMVVTMDVYKENNLSKNGLINKSKSKNALKEIQTVVAVGDSVQGIKVGDKVCINPIRYAVQEHEKGSLKNNIITDNPVTRYNFDIIVLDGKTNMIISDRDIKYIVLQSKEV